MLGNKAEERISKIPPSNNIAQRRIITMSDNIEEDIIAKLQMKLFALQIDEFTDISNYEQLMAFMCFIEEDAIMLSMLPKVTHNYKRSGCF